MCTNYSRNEPTAVQYAKYAKADGVVEHGVRYGVVEGGREGASCNAGGRRRPGSATLVAAAGQPRHGPQASDMCADARPRALARPAVDAGSRLHKGGSRARLPVAVTAL
eukprot:3700333-Prymnesium_polylepis.2